MLSPVWSAELKPLVYFGVMYRPACWRLYLPLLLKALTGESLNLFYYYSVFSLWNSMNLWLCNSWQRWWIPLLFALWVLCLVLLSMGSDRVLPAVLYAFQCLACRNSAEIKISALNAWSKCGCARPRAYWMDQLSDCQPCARKDGRRELPVVIHCWGSVTRCSDKRKLKDTSWERSLSRSSVSQNLLWRSSCCNSSWCQITAWCLLLQLQVWLQLSAEHGAVGAPEAISVLLLHLVRWKLRHKAGVEISWCM